MPFSFCNGCVAYDSSGDGIFAFIILLLISLPFLKLLYFIYKKEIDNIEIKGDEKKWFCFY